MSLKRVRHVGYLIQKSGVNNGYYFVSKKEYTHVERRFRRIYMPIYVDAASARGHAKAKRGR